MWYKETGDSCKIQRGDQLQKEEKREEHQEQELLSEIRRLNELEMESSKDSTLERLMSEQREALMSYQRKQKDLMNALKKEGNRSFDDSRDSIATINKEIKKRMI